MHDDPDAWQFLVAYMLFTIPFMGVGAVIAFAPATRLLEWDRKTGYGIYNRELEASGDEDKAIRKAGRFYRVFGLVFLIFSLGHFVAGATLLLLWFFRV